MRTSAGFTLVELLVTVTVLGILSTLAVLSLSGARTSSNQNSCKTSAQAVTLSVASFRSDNGGAIPTPVSSTETGYSTNTAWQTLNASFNSGNSVPVLEFRTLTLPRTVGTTVSPPYISSSLLSASSDTFSLGLQTSATNGDGFEVTVYRGSGATPIGVAPAACDQLT